MSPQISTTLTNAWMICCILQPISTTPRTAETTKKHAGNKGWMVDGKCSDIMMPPATWEMNPTGFWWWNIYWWRWAPPKVGMFHLTETWLKPVVFPKRAVKKPRAKVFLVVVIIIIVVVVVGVEQLQEDHVGHARRCGQLHLGSNRVGNGNDKRWWSWCFWCC